MAEMSIWYCDELGHPTGRETWSPTMLHLQEGYLLQGDSIDFSNPDEGIFWTRYYVSFAEDEVGELCSLTAPEIDRVLVLSPSVLTRVLTLEVDGCVVLRRATTDEVPAFAESGLTWPDGIIGAGELEEESPEEETFDPPAEVQAQ